MSSLTAIQTQPLGEAQDPITANTTVKQTMIRATLTTAALAIGTMAAPAMAEIVPSKCTFHKYQPTNTTRTFDCDFRQSGGNVTVNSKYRVFTFLAKDQDIKYIRINDPLTFLSFTKNGQYSLKVVQGPRVQR